MNSIEKNKIIVLAGNRQEFERYLDKNGMTDTEAIYGCEPQRICGYRAERVVIVGTFWERKDAGKLKDLADSRVF